MSILDQIIETKREEIALAKTRVPLESLKERIASMERPRNFFRAVTTPGKKPLNLIAEVKKASPSAGIIRQDFDPVAIAQTYAKHGAACVKPAGSTPTARKPAPSGASSPRI